MDCHAAIITEREGQKIKLRGSKMAALLTWINFKLFILDYYLKYKNHEVLFSHTTCFIQPWHHSSYFSVYYCLWNTRCVQRVHLHSLCSVFIIKSLLSSLPCCPGSVGQKSTSSVWLLPFYNIKIVTIVSLVNNMLLGLNSRLKHGI